MSIFWCYSLGGAGWQANEGSLGADERVCRRSIWWWCFWCWNDGIVGADWLWRLEWRTNIMYWILGIFHSSQFRRNNSKNNKKMMKKTFSKNENCCCSYFGSSFTSSSCCRKCFLFWIIFIFHSTVWIA